MALKVYQTIQDQVLQPFQNFAANGATQISTEIGRTLTAAMTVYICWYGWMILRGSIQEPVQEFTVRAMKLCVIAMLVLNASTYKDMIADPLSTAIPDGISKLISGKTVPDVSVFDTLQTDIAVHGYQMLQGVSWTTPSKSVNLVILALLLWGVGTATLAVMFVSTLYAKAALWFVLALGPVFIAFALFESTRGYLHGFTNTAVTLVTLQVLIAALASLLVQTIGKAVSLVDPAQQAEGVMGVVATCVFALFFNNRLPDLASRLGGYGFQTSGIRINPFRNPFQNQGPSNRSNANTTERDRIASDTDRVGGTQGRS